MLMYADKAIQDIGEGKYAESNQGMLASVSDFEAGATMTMYKILEPDNCRSKA